MSGRSIEEDTLNALIYVVDDDPHLSKDLEMKLQRGGFTTQAFNSGEELLESLETSIPHVVVLDLIMPGIGGMETLVKIKEIDPNLPVVVMSAQEKVSTAIETIRQGAYEYIIKPLEEEQIVSTVRHAVMQRNISMELSKLRQQVKNSATFDRMIGRSRPMQQIFKLISRTLNNDITVLILGESGTGKELAAKAIHYNGIRSDKPFVVVNCAAIPRELVESELFGHEKGSFTGALDRKIGKFELANNGTLFLDEIGELELSVQSKLLRALQEREIERVGGAKPIKINVRLVCATQRELDIEVKENRFREDLYYRINAFPVTMPPLRDRPGDIPLLCGHFLDKHSHHLARDDIKGFSATTLEILRNYEWPGNVRQLENIITRAIVLSDGDSVRPDNLPIDILEASGEITVSIEPEEDINYDYDEYSMDASPHVVVDSEYESGSGWPKFESEKDVPTLEEIKAWAIEKAFKACNENVSLTAKKLGLGRATLYRMLEKYGMQEKKEKDLVE